MGECGKKVFCSKGYGECNSLVDQFDCPLVGCSGSFEPDQIVFYQCTYYAEYQKKVEGRIIPSGQNQYHTSNAKTTRGDNYDQFLACEESALVNYRTLRFYAS